MTWSGTHALNRKPRLANSEPDHFESTFELKGQISHHIAEQETHQKTVRN